MAIIVAFLRGFYKKYFGTETILATINTYAKNHPVSVV